MDTNWADFGLPGHRRSVVISTRLSIVALAAFLLCACNDRAGSYRDAHGSSGCTEDCSGHEAGWRWARRHHVTDPDRCGGNSESFKEGCRAYAGA